MDLSAGKGPGRHLRKSSRKSTWNTRNTRNTRSTRSTARPAGPGQCHEIQTWNSGMEFLAVTPNVSQERLASCPSQSCSEFKSELRFRVADTPRCWMAQSTCRRCSGRCLSCRRAWAECPQPSALRSHPGNSSKLGTFP